MSVAGQIDPAFLQRMAGPELEGAVKKMLGEAPERIDIARTHFPGQRPMQMALSVLLSSGRSVPLWAEHSLDDPVGHADRIRHSLGKSRNGQKAALDPAAVLAVPGCDLVLRRLGFDERLPGLRLLHDPGFARQALADVVASDPGPVDARLVAHRLGKRAVLRLSAQGRAVYARLAAIKSGAGASRLGRHQAAWARLGGTGALRIPEPLGEIPDIGVAFFAVLPGGTPDFGPRDSASIVRALDALQALDPTGLPVHTGADEARLLAGWHDHCRAFRADLAHRIEPGLSRLCAVLEADATPPRPCHRDLHEKQILIADGVAGLLDLDTLCCAHPALDAGNLLAHLFLAELDEGPLRDRLARPGLGLWRSAALFRLAMIYAVTSTPDAVLDRLIREAMTHAVD
jgi:hypothetical protein